MITRYEHHLEIKAKKLEPFTLHHFTNLFDSPCNWHKNVEMILVLNGEGFIRYGTEEYSLSSGDFVIINSGVIHHLHSKTGFEYYCLIIDDEFCESNGIDVEKYEFEKLTVDEETVRVFLEAVELLKAEKNKKEKGKGEELDVPRLRRAMLSVMIELCEKHAANHGDGIKKRYKEEEHIKNALLYLNENFKSAITLEGVAKHVGITKYHLSREFKKYTGETIFTYTNILRCRNAEVCILEGMNVSDAAYASGFETISYFSCTYKRLMGEYPSKVKKQRLENK